MSSTAVISDAGSAKGDAVVVEEVARWSADGKGRAADGHGGAFLRRPRR